MKTNVVNDNINIEGTKRLCALLYAVFAASILIQFTLAGVALGSAALLAALIIAYVKRRATRGSVFESHFQWLIRTFWIGGGLLLPALTVLVSIPVALLLDTSMVQQAIDNAEVTDTGALVQLVMERNSGLINAALAAFTLPFALWWLWRCWRGYMFLKESQPVADAMRWI